MSSKSESVVQKWLRENVQTYPNSNIVYAHADAALTTHPTIRPKTDVYTYDDGRTQLLLCLHGLLPISFRGSSYNIPIAVWVPREYPRNPPIAYVVPTSDMLVRPGPDMDTSGRCLIDYLRNWERKCEGCDLVALLDAMKDAFSRQPPVYAKPKDVTATQQPQPSRPPSSAPDYAARPPPPVPLERHGPADRTAQPMASPAPPPNGPPPLPAKPGSSVSSPPIASRSVSVPVPHASANFRSEPPANLSTVRTRSLIVLVNLVAEDNAIEDTIYHLHRALNAGRIDLERFLRTTRLLAEEQFMKRALIEKIQAGIPHGDSMWSASSDLR
ncbi:UEV-domain-containing protein [Trametes sanguinea]|nr:UEV-domain-containing protein [Trametes sanguinea]